MGISLRFEREKLNTAIGNDINVRFNYFLISDIIYRKTRMSYVYKDDFNGPMEAIQVSFSTLPLTCLTLAHF